MGRKNINNKTYFELTEHTSLQLILFGIIASITFVITLYFIIPFMKDFFEVFLQGVVHDGGEPIPYSFQSTKDLRQPNYLLSWAIDFDVNSPNPMRYWFNPLLSISLISGLFSIAVSSIITALMPQKYGFLRQKIEREIANMLDRLCIYRYGYYGKEEQRQAADEILNSDIRDLHEMSSDSPLTFEDLKILKKGLRWINSGFFKRLLTVNCGIKLYMRFYFTAQYSNTMLGFVYIGAAFLIITIGLRGLKFIPPTQPSYVLFALGLEFCLLLVFAVTTIYARQEDDISDERHIQGGGSAFGTNYQSIGNDYGTAGEIEKLLKVFIKSNKDK